MKADKYRIFYGVDASHTTESKLFSTLKDARSFMRTIVDTHYFTLYHAEILEPVWDSLAQGDLTIARTRNEYRRIHGYKLLKEISCRYAI